MSKYVLILLSIALLIRCIRSMLSEGYEPEIWGYLRYNGETYTLTHWENIIGRSLNADVRVVSPGVSRVHAVLRRTDSGRWKVYDIFSKGASFLGSAVIAAVKFMGGSINIAVALLSIFFALGFIFLKLSDKQKAMNR